MSVAFSRLFAHLGWADREVLTALARAQEPDPGWIDLLAHVLGAEHVWLGRIEGRESRIAVWPDLTVEQCVRLAEENLAAFQRLVEHTPSGFDRMVPYRNSAGQAFESSIEDILLHVCLHGAYHRGQIARAMREGGAVPAATDYIGFVRGVPAATRQPG